MNDWKIKEVHDPSWPSAYKDGPEMRALGYRRHGWGWQKPDGSFHAWRRVRPWTYHEVIGIGVANVAAIKKLSFDP
jgi:hypothetical protein